MSRYALLLALCLYLVPPVVVLAGAGLYRWLQ